MRIKEVCERTGLTDRAIRLYMENGLVSPKQETNYMGRRSYIFSEDDVRVLEAVATLRRADFSIADIVQMQTSADSMPEIVSGHRQRIAEEISTKENILRTLEQYNSQTQKDYFDLATAISTSASRNSIPKEDSGMNLKDLKRMIRQRIPALIALCAIGVGCLVFMPSADAQRMYLFEFPFFRNNFKWVSFFHQVPDFVFKTIKYLPIVGSIVLSGVGFVLDKPAEAE